MEDRHAAVSVPPETHPAFRRGQLLLLLAQLQEPVTLERINLIDFLAANPYLVFRDDGNERTELLLSGMSPLALSYQAAKERYANRRSRLRSDLAALVAWGYASVTNVDGLRACVLTTEGQAAAESLCSLYADAYRASVRLMVKRFGRSTDAALSKNLQQWLNIDQFRIDLWDFQASDDSPTDRTTP